MESRFETLKARRDRFLAIGKWVLLLCAVLWLASIAFYDTAADPGVDRPKILLPSRLTYTLLVANIEHLDLRRIWGGPATGFGLASFACSLLVLGLAALARARLNRRPLSRTGAALALSSVPLFILTWQATALNVYPLFVDQASFRELTRAIEARQPRMVATLRAGIMPDLPADIGGGRRLRVLRGEGTRVGALDGDLSIRDRVDAETLRFALAQQAWIEGDRAALRRLLPIALAMPPTDRTARNDFAQRLAAMGRAAGVAPVPAVQAQWVAEGEAAWTLTLRFIRINRILIRITMLAGMLSLLIGLVLRRRVGQIERHRAEVGAPPAQPARSGFGRSNRGLTRQV